jgi:predicted MFS family arabinose efflux permease
VNLLHRLLSAIIDYAAHVRLFSRNARLYLAGAFCFGFGFGTFWVLLNLYLRALGLTDTQIGRVLSFQSLGTVLVAIPAGIIASRFRLKWLLIAATLVSGTAYTLLVTLRPFPLLLVVAAAAGGGFIIHGVLAAPFFMRNSTPTERLHLFGLNQAVEILASVVGVAGGGWLAGYLGDRLHSDVLGLRITLLVAVGLLLLAVIPYAFIHSPAPDRREVTRFRLRGYRNPKLLAKLAFPAFLVGSGAGLVIPFLNLYFRDRFALDAPAIGRIFAVAQCITALGFMLGPVMARRMGLVRAVVTTELLSIPFFLTLAFTYRLEVAVIAFWMRGALMNMNHPISRNFAMEVVGTDQQAIANSVLEMSWNLSWMISAQVGGWLIDHHGFALPMLITVVLYFSASNLYFQFFRRYEQRPDPATVSPA